MARVYMFVMIAVALTFLLPLAGINTGSQSITDLFLVATGQMTVSDFADSLFSNTLGLLTLVAVVAGIAIGFVLKGQIENFIILPFITGTLFTTAGAFTSIILKFNDFEPWIGSVVILLMGMFLAGYIITLVEFFRGNT